MEALPILGTSLLVPSVQELVKRSLIEVPSRYIHPVDAPITSTLPKVPIIDMEILLSGDQIELEKLDSTCKEWGFFQLINHGVKSSLLEKLKAEVKEFFYRPVEEKKLWQKPGDGFGDTLEVYTRQNKQLATKFLYYIAKALKMKPEEMSDLFDEETLFQTARINYYPPCPQPEKVTDLHPHSDAVGITILLQANEVEGLQIKKDGVYVLVQPLLETFIVNLGDILE
ncbi:hypothetical protein U1Q18_044968, partial [Sarracenia purpurea var. burkii]